jgi:spermidine synthase
MERFYRPRVLPVFALFLFSGATGLAYEVIWTRMLIRIFGATSFAVSTVLAAYMAGFALGSYFFGRYIDRKGNPLVVYGSLELGVGAFACLFPLLLAALNPLYHSLYAGLEGRLYSLSLIRFALSFTLLLIPATLMGGTLPVLSRFVTASLSNLTYRVGWLYSINTFGAVAGTFATGFVLLPHLGMRATTFVAVGVNVAIFATSLALRRADKEAGATAPAMAPAPAAPERGKRPAPVNDEAGEARVPVFAEPKPAALRHEKIVLFAFLATGLAALSAEVIWTRVLALVVGTTVYAFSIMLTVFLLGLALGSAVFARVAQRVRRPGLCFAALVSAVGFVVFASTVAFSRLPALYMELYARMPKTWHGGVTIEFLLSGLIMIAPAFLMGGTFPLVARIYATDLKRVGGRIGTAYAFNTVGSIFGSFIGSFVLLELVGVEKGMLIVALIYLAVGIALLLSVSEIAGRRARLAAAAAVAAAALVMIGFTPPWDRELMTSGVYVYAPSYETRAGMEEQIRSKRLLFYDEGPGATVSVERSLNVLSLKIDGKVDASTAGDMITQRLIAHLPLLMHPRPDTVLVIGLGSGVSLGSAEQYPARHIDCVELLPNVVKAAGFYSEFTHNCLADPRLSLIKGDGRNHVLLSDKQYDVIISEPTNVWISGVGDLFTYEFFKLARERLKPGGVMSAWFHTYHMGDAELRAGIKTFTSVFPHATMWLANESDLVLIGALEPPRIDGQIVARAKDPRVAADLAGVGVNDVSDILSALLFNEEDLRAYGDASRRLHTDDNMLMEFNAGRRVLEATHIIHLTNIVGRLKPNYFKYLDVGTNERVMRQAEAKKLALEGTLERLRGRPKQALDLYDAAYAKAPGDPYVVSKYIEIHNGVGDAFLSQGKLEEAESEYAKVIAAPTVADSWVAYEGLGVAYLYAGEAGKARDALLGALQINPYGAPSNAFLGDALIALADTAGALAAYEKALDLAPWDYSFANNVAWYLVARGENLGRALELAKTAAAGPPQANYLDTLGWAYYAMKQFGKAAEPLRQALKLEPGRVETIYHLALVMQAEGNTGEMRKLLGDVVKLDPAGVLGRKAAALLN